MLMNSTDYSGEEIGHIEFSNNEYLFKTYDPFRGKYYNFIRYKIVVIQDKCFELHAGYRVDTIKFIRKPIITISNNVKNLNFTLIATRLIEENLFDNNYRKIDEVYFDYNEEKYSHYHKYGNIGLSVVEGKVRLVESFGTGGNIFIGGIIYFTDNKGIIKFNNGPALYAVKDGLAEIEITQHEIIISYIIYPDIYYQGWKNEFIPETGLIKRIIFFNKLD